VKIAAPAAALDAAMSLAVLPADKKTDTPVRIAADRVVTCTVVNPRAAISIKATTAASIAEPGNGAVSAWRFAALLSGFNREQSKAIISIETGETAMDITCGAARYRLPLLRDPPGALVIDAEIGRADLATADCCKLFEVIAAAGTERSRYYLIGVFLRHAGGKLTSAAMDGTKALCVSIASDDQLSTDNRLIVPTPAVTMLLRLLRQVKPERVLLRRSRAVFSASAPGFEIVSGMIDAAFPDYQRVLPRAGTDAASCQRVELLGALARLKAVAGGESPLIGLEWAAGGPLRLCVARQPDAGTEPIAAKTTGTARKAFSLSELTALITEFSDAAITLEAADRGLLIRQGSKLGALAECAWHEREIAA
jgi:DNA polymerase-3 subunit beta